ncbi:hypothetical protein H9P43_004123 [Blastocladiella emersonii ATCC 22665]|nr:hypothetical protein H9P43_004123 [Blastocladiella emersonii ATCC 22665]
MASVDPAAASATTSAFSSPTLPTPTSTDSSTTTTTATSASATTTTDAASSVTPTSTVVSAADTASPGIASPASASTAIIAAAAPTPIPVDMTASIRAPATTNGGSGSSGTLPDSSTASSSHSALSSPTTLLSIALAGLAFVAVLAMTLYIRRSKKRRRHTTWMLPESLRTVHRPPPGGSAPQHRVFQPTATTIAVVPPASASAASMDRVTPPAPVLAAGRLGTASLASSTHHSCSPVGSPSLATERLYLPHSHTMVDVPLGPAPAGMSRPAATAAGDTRGSSRSSLAFLGAVLTAAAPNLARRSTQLWRQAAGAGTAAPANTRVGSDASRSTMSSFYSPWPMEDGTSAGDGSGGGDARLSSGSAATSRGSVPMLSMDRTLQSIPEEAWDDGRCAAAATGTPSAMEAGAGGGTLDRKPSIHMRWDRMWSKA